MKMQAYLDEIKLDVTGGILSLEIDDATLTKIVNSALRELQRYVNSTQILTLTYSKCIDLKKYKINTITKVFRTNAVGLTSNGSTSMDPLQLSFYQIQSGGNMLNLNDAIMNYAAFNTARQLQNTVSTDLSFYHDEAAKKLYINTTVQPGTNITIEYIPRYDKVEDVVSDYWIDILMRLSKALTKITLGRVRGRYKQTNALWISDADTMLQQGQTELQELRQYLQSNTQLIYPID